MPFKVGDMVWAKMKGFPEWPAIVVEPPKELKKMIVAKNKGHCVFFFGHRNFSWMEEKALMKYNRDEKLRSKSLIKKALKDADNYVKTKDQSIFQTKMTKPKPSSAAPTKKKDEDKKSPVKRKISKVEASNKASEDASLAKKKRGNPEKKTDGKVPAVKKPSTPLIKNKTPRIKLLKSEEKKKLQNKSSDLNDSSLKSGIKRTTRTSTKSLGSDNSAETQAKLQKPNQLDKDKALTKQSEKSDDSKKNLTEEEDKNRPLVLKIVFDGDKNNQPSNENK